MIFFPDSKVCDYWIERREEEKEGDEYGTK